MDQSISTFLFLFVFATSQLCVADDHLENADGSGVVAHQSGEESAIPKSTPNSPHPEAPGRKQDLLWGPVDPFLEGTQRAKFLRDAGADSELDVEEFKRSVHSQEGFGRAFDRWEVLLRFDADGNGSLDWFEALAYRGTLHDYVLAACDLDQDQKLVGRERERALDVLSNPVPLLPNKGGSELRGQPADIGSTKVDRPVPVERLTITPEDYEAGTEHISEKIRVFQARREAAAPSRASLVAKKPVLKKFDVNGNGKLDTDEYDRFDRSRLEIFFDSDRDGELSDAENAKLKASPLLTLIERQRNYDINQDGLHDDTEHAQLRSAYKQEVLKEMAATQSLVPGILKELVPSSDADGDGELNTSERQVFRSRLREKLRSTSNGEPPGENGPM